MGNVSYSAHISNGKSAITSKSKLLGVAKHNLRKYKSPEYSSDNILLLRGTEDLYQDVKNVYHQEFDEVVQQYNQKHKRADRRIEDYFEHVANLEQDMAVEIIFQCGDKKFWEEHMDKKEKMYNVYAYLLSTMERLLPNFKVANAVIHFDEASPHRVRLSEERKKEERLTKINTKQTEIIEQISLSKERIFEKQRMYYELGQQICGQIQLEKDELSIMPKLSYNQEKLQMFVDSYLNARNPLAKAMQEADIIDNESLINVLTNAFDNIVKGIVPLKGGKDKKQAAVELLSTNYYYFMYNVVYQGDTLSSMSEGKKAFVILRLLLDFDENKYPILIDQPEDDLDNRAIYNDLVTYIRNKKLERQIILVTHNPNITVGTDAEEIIVANQHGAHTENQDGVKFEYRSGAIENSYKRDGTKTVLLSQGIREHVCDLLEGGDIAFKKRESKYGLKK